MGVNDDNLEEIVEKESLGSSVVSIGTAVSRFAIKSTLALLASRIYGGLEPEYQKGKEDKYGLPRGTLTALNIAPWGLLAIGLEAGGYILGDHANTSVETINNVAKIGGTVSLLAAVTNVIWTTHRIIDFAKHKEPNPSYGGFEGAFVLANRLLKRQNIHIAKPIALAHDWTERKIESLYERLQRSYQGEHRDESATPSA